MIQSNGMKMLRWLPCLSASQARETTSGSLSITLVLPSGPSFTKKNACNDEHERDAMKMLQNFNEDVVLGN